LVAGIATTAYIVAGLCVALGGLLTCLVMWAVALALFAVVVFLLKSKNKKA